MSIITKVLEARKMKGEDPCWSGYKMLGMKTKDGKKVPNCVSEEEKEEEEDTADFKVSKSGKKYKAHKIVFNKGEDDGTKNVAEQHGVTEMKKTFKEFAKGIKEKSTCEEVDLVGEELDEAIDEVLSKDDAAGKWISDFVHSDNPKFEGKSKEKRKQMALAAYYAKQRNEEVEEIDELSNKSYASYYKKATSVSSLTGGKSAQRRAGIKRATTGMATSAEKMRKQNEEVDEAMSPQAKTTMKHVKNATPGEKKAAKDIKPGVAGYRDRIAMLQSAAARGGLKKEEAESKLKEAFPGKDYKSVMPSSSTSTFHDVKKTSTGTVYSKKFKPDGTSMGSGSDAAPAPKRGRGRPKKKFAEAVEILLALSEEDFDSFMEEGFETFAEALDQLTEQELDELKRSL